MVRTVNISKEKLRELFEEVKLCTNGFTLINPIVLAENSQRLVVFRMALGISGEKFAKLSGRNNACIYNLEKKSRPINFNTAEWYISVLKRFDFTEITFDDVVKNYEQFYGRALYGIKFLSKNEMKNFAKQGSSKALMLRKINKEAYYKASKLGLNKQPLTSHEKEIVALLEQDDIPYKVHDLIGDENVDIHISGKFPIIISCCRFINNKNVTRHARRLMYQAYRIKYHDKNIKYVAVLSNAEKNLQSENMPIGAIKLLDEICDSWFVDSTIYKLVSNIKGWF